MNVLNQTKSCRNKVIVSYIRAKSNRPCKTRKIIPAKAKSGN